MENIERKLLDLEEERKMYLEKTRSSIDDLRENFKKWMYSMQQIPLCFTDNIEEQSDAIAELKYMIRVHAGDADSQGLNPKKTVEKFISAYQKNIMKQLRNINDFLSETSRSKSEIPLLFSKKDKPRQDNAEKENDHHAVDVEVVISSPGPSPSKRSDLTSEEPNSKKIRTEESNPIPKESSFFSNNVNERGENEFPEFAMDVRNSIQNSGEKNSEEYSDTGTVTSEVPSLYALGFTSPRIYDKNPVDTETQYIKECLVKAKGVLSFDRLKAFLEEVKSKQLKEIFNISQNYTCDIGSLLQQLFDLKKYIIEVHQTFKKNPYLQVKNFDKRLFQRLDNIMQALQYYLSWQISGLTAEE